jgi:hypothetical protein
MVAGFSQRIASPGTGWDVVCESKGAVYRRTRAVRAWRHARRIT